MVHAKTVEITFLPERTRPGYILRRVVSCNIKSSWEALTDKAEVVIPRAIKGMSIETIRDSFRVGDRVIISLGYDGVLKEEFKGYLIALEDARNITFKFQDEMYKLKTGSINFAKKNCTLLQLLEHIAPGYTIDCPEAQLGNVRIKDMSAAAVLDQIKSGYGIYSYFTNGTLVSGKVFQGNKRRYKINFDFNRNIRAHSLTYKRAEDLRVKIKCSSVNLRGEKIEVTVGDEDGAVSDLQLIGIKSLADLKAKAEAKLALMKTDGYEGTITLFGRPAVRFGDEVEVHSEIHPERDGVYYVDSTELKYEVGQGIQRILKIGGRAA